MEVKSIGYYSRKGEKSIVKDRNGVALFSNTQVNLKIEKYDFDEIFMEQLERECTNPND